MIIGIPKELKSGERRVGIDPYWTGIFVRKGHKVLIEKEAGVLSGFGDKDYIEAGAKIIDTREILWADAEMIIKVKELEPQEYALPQNGQILYSFIHLGEEEDMKVFTLLKESGATVIAFEHLIDNNVKLALAPMSELAAWNAAIQMAKLLYEPEGSMGIALGNFSGFPSARITILGGGTVGQFAAKTLIGIGAEITILEKNYNRIVELKKYFEGSARVLYSNDENLRLSLGESVGLINALYPGPGCINLVTREHLTLMPEKSVIIDVGGGNVIETMRYTKLEDPTFIEENRIHYCVDNSPAQMAKTASKILANITIPYGIIIADKGLIEAAKVNPIIKNAINFYNRKVVHPEIAVMHQAEVE
ncbi:MAG: alanine dehydrogenase [Desulfobacterales bacterium]|nr:alanine dehydrogenase [Desulfobacterales bacterium]